MPTKKIFVIRHGQTQANVDKVFQDFNDPLTELGYKQIEYVAQRAVELQPEVIISSTMQRALETAKRIQKTTQAELVEQESLRENMVPTSLLNKPYGCEESKEYHKQLYANLEDPNWRYADEDNYLDLYNRAKRIMEMLATRQEKRILLVSHGAFISTLLNTMMCEGETSPVSARRMFRFLRKENTGISIIEYHEDAIRANKWRLKVWNDYSHLPRELRTLP